jgi:Secretion system C-terminal sorting domain
MSTVGYPETTQKEVGAISKPSAMKKYFIFCISQLFFLFTLKAQYVEFPLEQRVTQSDLIVEAKVIDQFSYKKAGLIYTANKLEVCAVVFKKVAPTAENLSTVYVITYGGELNGEFNTWTHMLTLNKGMEGLFFLKSNFSILPEAPPSNSSFYDVYGQEQGFVTYAKDDNWGFSGNSLFEAFNNADDYIGKINNITEQDNVTKSCIVGNKSGIVLKLDTAIVGQGNITFKSSIKGQWGKGYKLEKVKIQIEFNSSINLAQYNFSVGALTSTLSTHYGISWSQPNSHSAVLEVTKNNGTTTYQQLGSQFSEFLSISFHPSLLAVGVKSVQIVDAKFKDGNSIQNFLEYEIFYNKLIKEYFAAPVITSFEPAEVCAGVKAEQSSGNPVIAGHVIIKGDNFGDIDPADFATEIPENYRVEFRREEDLTSNAFKVTPLTEDYVYWTNTEIKVKVPTAGKLVNNSNLLSGDAVAANAVTGRITVKTPDGVDDTGDDKLKVLFAHFNSIEIGNSNHSLAHKLLNKSGNGGYYLIFDSSFEGIHNNEQAARKDVIDAFCEWNAISQAKIEVVETCPTGAICYKVKYEFIDNAGSSSIVLARGLSSGSQFGCSNEYTIGFIELTFNSAIDNWKVSSEAGPSDPFVIKPTTYHEGGHLLQLGHVYNEDALMYPLYSSDFLIDADASAGGTHVANVSAATNCANKLNKGLISSCMTPTSEGEQNSFVRVTPNPVKDELLIDFGQDFVSGEVTIHDSNGKICQVVNISPNSNRIDTSDLLPGFYVLAFHCESYLVNFKLLKL